MNDAPVLAGAPPNKSLNASGYFFGDSTVKLLERYILIRRRSWWSAAALTQTLLANAVMATSEDFYIYDTVIDGNHRYFASLLPHDAGFAAGLPSEAIMGEFTDGPESLTPESFQQNSRFIQFLAFVIGKHANACPGLIAETKRQ